MSVLPDNISGLTCIVQIDHGAKECAIMSKFLLSNCIVIKFTPAFSFFSFKGEEAVHWRLHLIEQLL